VIDLANLKAELAACEKIDAIRAKYPNPTDALKRDTECFTIWRTHTLGVQERLKAKLKTAAYVNATEAYTVAGEYVAATDNVFFLPPVGYAESLKKHLADLEK